MVVSVRQLPEATSSLLVWSTVGEMKFKPIHDLVCHAEVLRICVGYLYSKDILDEHHSFNNIEAIHLV